MGGFPGKRKWAVALLVSGLITGSQSQTGIPATPQWATVAGFTRSPQYVLTPRLRAIQGGASPHGGKALAGRLPASSAGRPMGALCVSNHAVLACGVTTTFRWPAAGLQAFDGHNVRPREAGIVRRSVLPVRRCRGVLPSARPRSCLARHGAERVGSVYLTKLGYGSTGAFRLSTRIGLVLPVPCRKGDRHLPSPCFPVRPAVTRGPCRTAVAV